MLSIKNMYLIPRACW